MKSDFDKKKRVEMAVNFREKILAKDENFRAEIHRCKFNVHVGFSFVLDNTRLTF